MSFQRFLSIQRLSVANRRIFSKAGVKPTHLQRWQSSDVVRKSGSVRWGRLAFYGLTTTGFVLGGTLAYANYDPGFKDQVDSYVPGFSSLADFAADKWVDLRDYVNPKQSSSVGLKVEKDKVKIGPGFESIKVKRETANQEDTEPIVVQPQRKEKEKVVTQEETVPVISEKQESSLKRTVMTEMSLKEQRQHVGGEGSVPSPPREAQTTDKSEKVAESKKPTPSKLAVEEPKRPEVVEGGTKDVNELEEKKPHPEVRASAEPKESVDEKELLGATVESVVKEETAKAAQETMSEQVKDPQAEQMTDEHLQWLKDSAEVEDKLQEVYDVFMSLSEKVLEAQKKITQAIKAQMEATKMPPEDIAKSEDAIQAATKELEVAQEEHKETTATLKSLLDSAMGLGLQSKVEQIEGKIAEVATELLAGAASTVAAGKAPEEYQQETQRSREELQRELGTLLPESDSQEEVLISMLQKKVDTLKHQLEEVEGEYSQRLVAALEEQKEKLEQLGEERMKSKLQTSKHEFQQELQQKLDEVGRDYESELREQLRIQMDAHTHHLAEAMQTQATQLGTKWSSELGARLAEQEHFYQRELAGALARLKGIESMVNTVANAGETTQRQQGLRTACDTLNMALQRANSNPDPTEYYSFASEIAAMRNACQGDHFILSMLNSIPQAALNGIMSDAGLKERFRKVKRICRRVALVPETGGGLGTYFLSFIQSLLTISAWKSTAVDGVSPSNKMDTFDLLSLADVQLSRSNLEGAVQAANCLQGEPRRVAQDWLRDARLYLETRQAVELISQYIAATSISIVL